MPEFRSSHQDVLLPRRITTWEWLFEDPTYSPLSRYPRKELAGFTDAITKERLSYQDIKDNATYLSTALVKKYGLKENETVSLFSANTIWYPVAMYATLRVGGRVSGASPAYNVEEMAYALKTAEAKFLMTHPDSIEVAVKAAQKANVSRESIFLLEGELQGFKNVKSLIQEGKNIREQVPYFRIPRGKTNFDVIGFLSFSSGTTGLPKAVMIAHQNVIAQCLQIHQVSSSDHKRVLAVLPSFHITGLVHILHLPLLLNAEVYFLPSFTMKTMLDAIVEYSILELLLVPPILIRFVRDPLVSTYDLSCVRRFSSGAAPLPPEIVKQLSAKFPGRGFKQGYGMTESCSCITTTPPWLYSFDYAHTVGTVCASTVVKIIKTTIDPTTSREIEQECGVGEAGEIFARGPQISPGYLHNPEATASTFDKEGFLRTGDIGCIDSNGILTILDRIKELIKVKGVSVAPAELESLLLAHPLIEDVAVLGIPDEYAGEVPKAFVQLKPGLEETHGIGREVLKFVRENKERNKRVREVEFVDVVPKSASGKILRRVLRERQKGGPQGVVVREERANL